MASETVRIHPGTHVKLKELADQSGQSMTDVVEQAVEALRRQRFLEALNADFAALRGDVRAWKEELAERKAWDRTLADGLEDD
jgi:predicted transcriptional regulator